MGGGNLLIGVLDQVQVLNQEITPARPVAEQSGDLFRSNMVDLASLGGRLGAPPPLSGVFEWADLVHVMAHEWIPFLASPEPI
jgi:hypothetical protein